MNKNFDHIIRGAFKFIPLVLYFCHYAHLNSLHVLSHTTVVCCVLSHTTVQSDNPFFPGLYPQYSSQKVVFWCEIFTYTMVYMILFTGGAGSATSWRGGRRVTGCWAWGTLTLCCGPGSRCCQCSSVRRSKMNF